MDNKWYKPSTEERRRRRREGQEAYRRAHGIAPRPRPRGDPAGAEVEYTDEEREFLAAVDRWKGETGTRFPTLTQLLALFKSLGYRKEARR
jgi:hypothetical protein